jgi:hypothetical protein
MGRPHARTILLPALLAAVACSSQPEAPRTADELRTAIAGYQQGEPEATEDRINALFARLDADIAARRADAAGASASKREPLLRDVEALEQQRRELQQAWITARLTRVGATAGDALRGLGESLGRGLEDAGRRLREALEEGAGRPAAPESPPPR